MNQFFKFTLCIPFFIFIQKYSIKKLKEGDFDIFHSTYYNPYFLNELHNKPYIITVYDMIHEKFNNKNKSFINRKLVAMQRANHIICISESTKKDLLEYYPFLNDK